MERTILALIHQNYIEGCDSKLLPANAIVRNGKLVLQVPDEKIGDCQHYSDEDAVQEYVASVLADDKTKILVEFIKIGENWYGEKKYKKD